MRGLFCFGKPKTAFCRIGKETIKRKDMKWLTLKRIKQQLRIELDFTEEDEILEMYGDSAEDAILKVLNRSYTDLSDVYGHIPAPVVHASLLLVGTAYKDRETDLVQEAHDNKTFRFLLAPYMRLTSSEDAGDVTYVTLGSDTKIEFTADLPDGLLLKDINFSGKVINADEKVKELNFTKADCIMVGDGADYVVLVDTEALGVGSYMLRLTVQIPDTDYPSGYRKEVVKINPHVTVKG